MKCFCTIANKKIKIKLVIIFMVVGGLKNI